MFIFSVTKYSDAVGCEYGVGENGIYITIWSVNPNQSKRVHISKYLNPFDWIVIEEDQENDGLTLERIQKLLKKYKLHRIGKVNSAVLTRGYNMYHGKSL